MKRVLTNPVYVTLLAVLCNVLWGSAYPAVKIGYELFSITDSVFEKLFFAGARFTAAGAMVLAVSWITRRKFPRVSRSGMPYVLMMAMVYTAVQYIFFYVGLSNTTGTNGSIVNSTQTFFAVILAHFAYKDDRLSARKIIGTALGFAGVLAVTLGGASRPTLTGEGFILLAALSFVIGSMISKKAAETDDAMAVTGYNLLIGGAVLIAAGLIGGGGFKAVTARGIEVLAYLAFLSAAAFTIWTMLLQYNPLGKIAVFNFIIPVSGTLLSAAFLGENILEPRYFVSLALVCAGIIIVNGNIKKTG